MILNSVVGTIQKVTSDQILVDAGARGLVKLNLSSTSQIWKGEWNSKSPFQTGDEIDAWGKPQADGKIVELEKAWINIVSIDGVTRNLMHNASNFNLDKQNVHSTPIICNEKTEIVMPSAQAPAVMRASSLQISAEYIGQVIGLRLGDGSVLATRIFLDRTVQEADKLSNSESPINNASVNQTQAAFYAGTLAYFTICNGSNGSCASYGYPCSNSSYHLAWPKLSTTNCNYTCASSLPWLACGAQVWVRNDCFNTSLYGQVRTCSTMSLGGCPTTYYCNGSPGSGLKPLLELTSTMFKALGGNLNDGREAGTIYA